METLNGEAKALQRKVDTFDPARNGYKEVSLSMVCQWSVNGLSLATLFFFHMPHSILFPIYHPIPF